MLGFCKKSIFRLFLHIILAIYKQHDIRRTYLLRKNTKKRTVSQLLCSSMATLQEQTKIHSSDNLRRAIIFALQMNYCQVSDYAFLCKEVQRARLFLFGGTSSSNLIIFIITRY